MVDVGGVLDQTVVVAREAGRRVAADHPAAGVRPGADGVGAVTGGEEVRLAVLDHVEAERAAAARAGDGVTAGDEGAELALRALDLGLVAQGVDDLGELGPLVPGHRAVDGDDDLVGDGVGDPRGTRDGRVLRQRRLGGVQLGEGVADDSGLRAGLLHLLGGALVEHVDHERLGLGVVVGARRGAVDVLQQRRGEVSGLRRGQDLGLGNLRGLTGVRSLEAHARGDEHGDARARQGLTAHGNTTVVQLMSSCGGFDTGDCGDLAAPKGLTGAHYSDPRRAHTRSSSGRVYVNRRTSPALRAPEVIAPVFAEQTLRVSNLSTHREV
ncbi:hypothetical protein CLAUR_047810 (plasmid) [Clostridium felsineum]|nr:hypothetical protein CLAUR_047810 [Clostridium felsineum]